MILWWICAKQKASTNGWMDFTAQQLYDTIKIDYKSKHYTVSVYKG